MELERVVIALLTSERFAVYRNILSVFGAAYVLRLLVRTACSVVEGFHAHCLAPLRASRIISTAGEHGSAWAIVTGASEGIGRAYAIELAKRGLNVALLSRSEEKLQKVATEIRDQYGRDVRCIAVDFTQGQKIYDDIQAEISDLDITVLVNNVALVNQCPNLTADVDEMQHRNMIEVNCQAMVQMCHLVLPKMIENKYGVIVNISSLLSCLPCPLYNVYSATKKFVVYFSDALRYEYRSKGIIVQTVIPAQVATAMTGLKEPHLFAPSPETYARAAVPTIGFHNKTFGYLPHAFMGAIMSSLPVWLKMKLMYNDSMDKRKKMLKQR